MNNSPAYRRSPLGLFSGHPAPRLYDRVVEIMPARHYSVRTQQAYCHWVKRFIYFHDVRHPAEMGEPEGIVAAACADSTACYKGQKPIFRVLCGSI